MIKRLTGKPSELKTLSCVPNSNSNCWNHCGCDDSIATGYGREDSASYGCDDSTSYGCEDSASCGSTSCC